MLSTNFTDGAPVWVDLGAPDVARAAGFYGSVFGWKFESAGPGAGGYGMFTQGGQDSGRGGPTQRARRGSVLDAVFQDLRR